MRRSRLVGRSAACLVFASCLTFPAVVRAQGVTTSAVSGIVTDTSGAPIEGATVLAIHTPSGTQYRARSRSGGAYTLPNVRVGGPYTITVTFIGFQPRNAEDVFLNLGETRRLDFRLIRVAAQLAGTQIIASRETEAVRTGAATVVDTLQVVAMPSIKRSTRDLTRLDPRSDGNFSFAGRNWLYNNITLDGSYFNNSFGLDDPAPGGQANAEPVPFDAVAQVQVAIAPFDVRQSGFTGASINTVTKSGTNDFRGSAYYFGRNDALQGNKVSGADVAANPSLKFLQSGLSVSGPIIRNKLFFFVNGEVERTDDPGTNFVASRNGATGFGISRVSADTMDMIRERLKQVYNYDPGPYDGYIDKTDNEKVLAKLDWNISANNTLSLRYNYLNALRDLPPHPFVLSFNNTGRGPNESSLPFKNSGYRMINRLNSLALEVNSLKTGYANRLFASYSGFRDHRNPFSAPFPTIEIGEGSVTYTTAGHEPFSIHNILDQDVWQLTDNLTFFRGSHVFTVGANFERFSFFNSFNIFRNGVFFLPPSTGVGTTFSSLAEFFQLTDPANPNRIDFNKLVGTGPYKGENIGVSQISVYGQDEFFLTSRFTLTAGVRVDVPKYLTDPVDNPFSRGLTALDENRQPEVVDQSRLPGSKPLFSPRVGFNWNAVGDRATLVRGGTGVFTGRLPFVWVGNVISNPGANPNLYPTAPPIETERGSVLQQSFDVNAVVPNFKWPQSWTTDLAVEQQLPWALRGTLEVMYAKDLYAPYVRNADLVAPKRTLPDGRPYFGGFGANELNPDGGAGIYVMDNTNKGYSFNVTAQLRKALGTVGSVGLGYSYTEAKNNLKSTEIASVLWQNQPVKGDPNNPELSWSEFGQPHRIVGDAVYTKTWSPRFRTQIGGFLEIAQGNRFSSTSTNRYSFIYSGDVNGDGQGGNDLIYIPRDQSEINLAPYTIPGGRTVSAAEQWAQLDAFIRQDDYLSKHRGEIAERFGGVNGWYSDVDLRILQDIGLYTGAKQHALQLSLDVLNVGNLLNSDWGVRKVASASATSPLKLVGSTPSGAPVFNFTGPTSTLIDDPGIASRWRIQLGLRYFFN
jgi:hypothetical protein